MSLIIINENCFLSISITVSTNLDNYIINFPVLCISLIEFMNFVNDSTNWI